MQRGALLWARIPDDGVDEARSMHDRCAARLLGRRIRLTMPLQIYAVPGRGLGLMGTLATSDVERLVQAIRGGDRAIALDFRSGVMSFRADAAAGLSASQPALGVGRDEGNITLCVVAGAVADALQAAGFEPAGEEPAGRFVLLID